MRNFLKRYRERHPYRDIDECIEVTQGLDNQIIVKFIHPYRAVEGQRLTVQMHFDPVQLTPGRVLFP